MPWHRVQDGLEEDRLAKDGTAFGSTRRGIAYAYSDKYRKRRSASAICSIWTRQGHRSGSK